MQCSPEVSESAASAFADYLHLKLRLLLLVKSIKKWFFCFYEEDTRFSNAAYLNFLAGYFKISGEHCLKSGPSLHRKVQGLCFLIWTNQPMLGNETQVFFS